MNYHYLFSQRRMTRAHSTQHTARTRQQGLQYPDLTLNEARIKRRAAVVHNMLQASVQLSLSYVQQLYNTKLEKPKCAFH